MKPQQLFQAYTRQSMETKTLERILRAVGGTMSDFFQEDRDANP